MSAAPTDAPLTGSSQTNTPASPCDGVVCQPGEACDVAADLYENIEAVAPCIAVIDQRSNIARSKYVLEKRNVVLLIILVCF